MWLTESVLGRFDNAELIRSLECRVEERTTELKEVNQQLRRDIAEREAGRNRPREVWQPASRDRGFRPNRVVRD